MFRFGVYSVRVWLFCGLELRVYRASNKDGAPKISTIDYVFKKRRINMKLHKDL